jgi:hypothetical protein
MRKVFLLLLVFVLCKTSQAQQNPFVKIKPNIQIPDSVLVLNVHPFNNRVQPNFENMPNPYKGMSNQLTKIGNNGTGFDLYQSTPDHMMILKPDSSNLAVTYMPNGYGPEDKMTILRKPKMNILLDTLSEIQLSVRPFTFPIIK